MKLSKMCWSEVCIVVFAVSSHHTHSFPLPPPEQNFSDIHYTQDGMKFSQSISSTCTNIILEMKQLWFCSFSLVLPNTENFNPCWINNATISPNKIMNKQPRDRGMFCEPQLNKHLILLLVGNKLSRNWIYWLTWFPRFA